MGSPVNTDQASGKSNPNTHAIPHTPAYSFTNTITHTVAYTISLSFSHAISYTLALAISDTVSCAFTYTHASAARMLSRFGRLNCNQRGFSPDFER